MSNQRPEEPKNKTTFSGLTSLAWSVADPLRGDCKRADYDKVILPFTVFRRLDCVLDATKDQDVTSQEIARRVYEQLRAKGDGNGR